jgi:hypothetical protein
LGHRDEAPTGQQGFGACATRSKVLFSGNFAGLLVVIAVIA